MTEVKDLLALPSLADMRLVGGARGLSNAVTWPYVILCPPISDWISGGEFLIYYGANQFVESVDLAELIREGAMSRAAGILLLVGEHFITEDSIDETLIACADELGFPVFTITSRAYVNSITKDIIHLIQNGRMPRDGTEFWYSLFLEQADTDDYATLNRALYLGYLPNCQYRVYIMQFMNADDYFRRILGTTNHLSQNHTEFFRMLAMKVNFLLANHTDRTWHFGIGSENVFVFPVDSPEQEASAESFLRASVEDLESQYPGAHFLIGKGMRDATLSGIRTSFIQARRCLMANTLQPGERIISYAGLGFYQLLFEIPAVDAAKEFAARYLGAILRYDEEHGAEIFETLTRFIDCRMNKLRTAKEMYLHRNTLQSRLSKAEALLGFSLDDPARLFDLQIAIHIHRFYRETKF